MTSDPSASYSSPSTSKDFGTSHLTPGQLTTNGSTTGPSDFVLSKGAVDRDAPSEHKDTYLGHLRAKVTSLQDDVNVFLTERMKEKNEEDQRESEMEKKLLDGGDDDDE